MWCLLICDMNVSHACAMDSEPLSSFMGERASNGTCPVSSPPHLKTGAKCSEFNIPNPCKSIPSVPCSHSFQFEPRSMPEVSEISKPKNSFVLSGLVMEKDGRNSASGTLKSFGATGVSQSSPWEEKVICSRKVHAGVTKREYILRQKSLHLERTHHTYRCKGSSRAGKLSGLGGLILDKKLKSLSDSNVALKNASLKISKAMGVDMPQDNGNHNLLINAGASSPSSFNLESKNSISAWPKTNIQSSLPAVNTLLPSPAANAPPTSLTADAELSLSLATKSTLAPVPLSCSAEAPSCSFTGIPYDKSLGQWIPHNKKDEMILKLVPRVREMQNMLQEWNEWANQKVMQATRRLSKDKVELKTLRQEKEEQEQLKKEKQTLEENTMKKLSEMENALSKASEQVEKANSAVRALEVENAELRQEMEAAKLRAAESAESCLEVSKREKTLMKFQSWEKQKTMFQEELITEKRKVAQLTQEVQQAKVLEAQFLDRWKQEEKAREDLLMQASSIRTEREQVEVSAKSKEDMIKLKAENNLLRYRDDIKKLENEISQLRLKSDSLKIAALRRGIDDINNGPDPKDSPPSYISQVLTDSHNYSETGVKRERECVMCLSEEMSVVFLPCAHQVVCTTCNELHEKQGMKDCPSCRTPIQRRIPVCYSRS